MKLCGKIACNILIIDIFNQNFARNERKGEKMKRFSKVFSILLKLLLR